MGCPFRRTKGLARGLLDRPGRLPAFVRSFPVSILPANLMHGPESFKVRKRSSPRQVADGRVSESCESWDDSLDSHAASESQENRPHDSPRASRPSRSSTLTPPMPRASGCAMATTRDSPRTSPAGSRAREGSAPTPTSRYRPTCSTRTAAPWT